MSNTRTARLGPATLYKRFGHYGKYADLVGAFDRPAWCLYHATTGDPIEAITHMLGLSERTVKEALRQARRAATT